MKSRGLKCPHKLAVAFHVQKVEKVPMELYDRYVDEVFFSE